MIQDEKNSEVTSQEVGEMFITDSYFWHLDLYFSLILYLASCTFSLILGSSKMILLSACLVGINCRYDGSNLLNNDLLKKIKSEGFVPVCPEQLGGLPTPRPRASIKNGTGVEVIAGKAKVINIKGKDVTKEFLKGAHESLKIAKLVGVKRAILKENSPSCGVDFTHSNFKKVKGTGIFTAMLKSEGIKIFSENKFEEL